MVNSLHLNRAARRAASFALAVSALVVPMTWVSGSTTAGDDDQRIEFSPGTDFGSVTGTFREGETDRFTLRAAAGQTMFVAVTPAEAGAAVAVFDPGGSTIAEAPEPGSDFSVGLPATGDYQITVGPGRAEVTSYTMTVRIPPLVSPTTSPPANEPQRIQFAPGTDNATVTGSIAPGTTTSFVLRAVAGQTMTVALGPNEFAALTTIFGPDGSVVGAGHTTATGTLPVTGDYVIDVGNTGSTTDFTLTVRIPAGSAAPAPPPGQLPATR